MNNKFLILLAALVVNFQDTHTGWERIDNDRNSKIKIARTFENKDKGLLAEVTQYRTSITKSINNNLDLYCHQDGNKPIYFGTRGTQECELYQALIYKTTTQKLDPLLLQQQMDSIKLKIDLLRERNKKDAQCIEEFAQNRFILALEQFELIQKHETEINEIIKEFNEYVNEIKDLVKEIESTNEN